MPASEVILTSLHSAGFDLATGVADSTLGPWMHAVETSPTWQHVPLSNEGEAVAYAAGAALAGRLPVVYMQNSGLGNALNPLSSLAMPFELPMILLVGWRGRPGRRDAPQHGAMGAMTRQLTSMIGPTVVLSDDAEEAAAQLEQVAARAVAERRPYGVLVSKGWFLPSENEGLDPSPVSGDMTRAEALTKVLEFAGKQIPVIATTGHTSRELFSLADRSANFYMVGSMGCAPSLALGVAETRPGPLVVVDGDGAALMRLEAWAGVAAAQPAGFVHVLLDNQVHASTGGQPTRASQVDFMAVARAVGYAHVARAQDGASLAAALRDAAGRDGPSLVYVRTSWAPGSAASRPDQPLSDYRDRFNKFLEDAS